MTSKAKRDQRTAHRCLAGQTLGNRCHHSHVVTVLSQHRPVRTWQAADFGPCDHECELSHQLSGSNASLHTLRRHPLLRNILPVKSQMKPTARARRCVKPAANSRKTATSPGIRKTVKDLFRICPTTRILADEVLENSNAGQASRVQICSGIPGGEAHPAPTILSFGCFSAASKHSRLTDRPPTSRSIQPACTSEPRADLHTRKEVLSRSPGSSANCPVCKSCSFPVGRCSAVNRGARKARRGSLTWAAQISRPKTPDSSFLPTLFGCCSHQFKAAKIRVSLHSKIFALKIQSTLRAQPKHSNDKPRGSFLQDSGTLRTCARAIRIAIKGKNA